MDHVDKIISQWNEARPDLDVGPMETIGRISRLARLLRKEMDKVWKEFGLTPAAFDVLATLRRAPNKEGLSPNELLAATMVTSGTMTNRIDQLVKKGLVKRVINENDKRGFLIGLTDDGFTLIDKAVEAHVKQQKKLMAGIGKRERNALNKMLRDLTNDLQD